MQTKFMDIKSSDSFVYTTYYDIYTSLGNLKTIHFGNPEWRRSHYGGFISIVTNKITISRILTNIIRSVVFDYSHRCVGRLQVKRYHRGAIFLRKRFFLPAKFEPPSWR